jgi:dsDNA-specific endonuclease/ATPase MutS2
VLKKVAAAACRVLELQVDCRFTSKISAVINEFGEVVDSASAAVQRTRGRVAAIEGRLRALLARHQGEITELNGRLCVAVAAGGARPRGSLLIGSGGGGSMEYYEPGVTVALNNELTAARAEALSAVESVLWELSVDVADRLADLRRLLDAVAWLDVACARHRYTEWLGGTLSEFGPFPWTQRPHREATQPWVRLNRLRHPLLYGWYLQRKAAWKRSEVRRTCSS